MSKGGDGARRQEIQGTLALVAVQVFFGLFPIFGKLAFAAFSPRVVAGYRVLFGAAVLGSFAALLEKRRFVPAPRLFPRLFACSLLGIVFNQWFFLEGLERAPAINAGLLMLVVPPATYALAMLVKQERWSAQRGAGLLVSCLGVAALLFGHVDMRREVLVGNALLTINALSYSAFMVIGRGLMKEMRPHVLIAWSYLLALWTVPAITWNKPWIPEGASARAWQSLAYILVFPTVLSYALNTYALARVRASTTAAWIALQPLIGGVGAVLILGEELTPQTFVAAALIFAGLGLVSLKRSAPPAAEP